MKLKLLSFASQLDLRHLRELVELPGLEIFFHQLEESEKGRLSPCDDVFLIAPEQGMMALGERIVRLREKLDPAVALTVCAPRPSPTDRDILHDCGATEIITPEGWRLPQVADRILAELIRRGAVTPATCGTILGATAPMRELYLRLDQVAPLHEPILILGETGTGKELVAREIHARSGRAGELLAINCAALTPDLLESELFGHERGAFSGAVASRKGLLAEAGPGTVFLDEIGDLALSSQAKLLRVLEERQVRRVGSNRWEPVEARVVLATHRNLETACLERSFREDLFHRISGFSLHLPPLRERKADLPLLADHFLAAYNREYPGERAAGSGAWDPLFRYHWPGNVRELRMAIWQAATYCSAHGGTIGALSLQEWTASRQPAVPAPRAQVPFDPQVDTWKIAQERMRATYFRILLRDCGDNKEEASRRAGISRSQLYEILKQIESEPNLPSA